MEYVRAETNFNLALQAFEGVFSHMTPSAISVSSMQGEENPIYEPMVSVRDVAILQDLLRFYQQFAVQNQYASGLQISPIEKWTCELIVFDTVFGGQWHHLKSYLDTLVLLNLYGGITVADTMKPLEM